MQHRLRAIVLRRTAYGEADWIVAFYCRERGRLTGIAKSARVSKRRFAGALEPGAVVDLAFSERRGSELVRLTEAQVVLPMHGVLRSLPRINALARTIQLALAFLREGEANPAKFDLLLDRMMVLSKAEPDPFETAAFELRWLALAGFAPMLGECVSCGEAVGAGGRAWRFSFERGGFVCPRCGLSATAAPVLSDAAMNGLISLSQDKAPDDAMDPAAAQAVLNGYIDHVLGKPMTTQTL